MSPPASLMLTWLIPEAWGQTTRDPHHHHVTMTGSQGSQSFWESYNPESRRMLCYVCSNVWIFALILMWSEECGQRHTAHAEHPMMSPGHWPRSLVLVSSQSSSHSLTISTFPGLCNCPDVSSPAFASSQATYANQSRAQMSRLGMGGESWEMFQTHGCDVRWGTTRLPSPSALAVKCAPIQILTPRAAPSCLLKHSYNWSSQLSWFLFKDVWCRYVLTPTSPYSPLTTIHLFLLLFYCYRDSSSWQKTVSGRSKCFRKTNEANVNFLPVVFRSNNVFRFTRRKKKQLKLS